MVAWRDVSESGGELVARYLAGEPLRETYSGHMSSRAADGSRGPLHRERRGRARARCRTVKRRETPILRWRRTDLTDAAEGTDLVVQTSKRLARAQVPTLEDCGSASLRRPRARDERASTCTSAHFPLGA
jgi:hypothetical protein